VVTTNPLSISDLPVLNISDKWHHPVGDFLFGFFDFACFQGLSMLWHVSVLCSFLWLNPFFKLIEDSWMEQGDFCSLSFL
jgi:hypothetical protein